MKRQMRFIFTLVTVFLLSVKVFSQGGDTWPTALSSPITLPFSAAGTTCGAVNDIDLGTGYSTNGKDWFYYFCAATTGTVDIYATNAYGVSNTIVVFDGTPDNIRTNYLTQTASINTINSIISLPVTAGTCYYIMMDSGPTATYPATCYDYTLGIRYHTKPPSSPLQPACTNMGYDAGNLGGWTGTTGAVTIGGAGAPTPNYTPLYYTTSVSQQTVTSGAGVDPYGGFPIVNPSGSPNSLRLGDFGTFGTANQYGPQGIPGAVGATLEQKFTVTASNALFVYYYAVVIQDAGSNHTSQEQPFFKTDIYDCSGVPVACGQYLVTGGPGIPGFILASGTADVYYKDWSPVAVDLTPYIGTCITVRYTVGDCTRGGHFAYAYLDASCSPLEITGPNIVCPTKSTIFTAPLGLYTYSWTPGGTTTQSIVVTPTTTTNYTCELTSYTNCKTFLTYSVSLFPQVFASATSQTICNGTAAAITTSANNTGGTYAWSPGGTSASGLAVSPAITTSYICTYTDPNGCQDTALSRVTVNPLPVMVNPSNISICNGATVAASSFSSNVAGTTYDWVNSNTSIGLAASGMGDTPSFTGLNVGSAPVNAIISVTPTANSCVGAPINYTITINPIPIVNAVPSGTYCKGTLIPTTTFTGNIASTTYSWANTNTTIGLAGSGTGNISSFSGINSGVSSITGVVTVTPSAFSCIGVTTNFSITVNPIPTVTVPISGSYCNGDIVPVSAFYGNIGSSTYDWSNTNSTIGIGASGTGNIASFSAVNNGAAPITGVISVTPSVNSCIGNPQSYSITVNPIPTVNAVPSGTYCNGVLAPAITFTGNLTSSIYNWSNTNSTIGIGASGAGNIASFNAINNGSSPITGVISVTPSVGSCVGNPQNFSLTVNPIPTVSAIPSGTYCNGILVPATTFTGNIVSTTYSWVNTNISIGLAGSGTGNISGFNGINTSVSSTTGVVTVTPSALSCIGTPTNFSITVNPIPTVTVPTSASYCHGDVVPAATFSGNIAGTTYNWSNTNSTIGIGASGAGNIASFNAINNGSSPITGVISVTPSVGSCVGNPQNFSITVNPIPTVSAALSGTYCNGVLVPATTFSGNIASTTYSWVNTNISIGVAGSGTGNISGFNGINTGVSSNIGVVTVTPSAFSCIGTPTNFSITVNPIPTVTVPVSASYCNGDVVPATTFSGNIAGTTYNWSNTNSTIGIGASGTGNIASFSAVNNGAVSITGVISVTPTVNSCVGNPQSFSIMVNPTPLAPTALNVTICPTSNTTLIATAPGGTYTWYDAQVAGNLLATNPSFVTPGLTLTTIYYVKTTNAFGCVSPFAPVTANVLNFLTVTASADQTICLGTNATLSVTPSGVGYTYLWDSPGNPAFSTISNPIVTPIITTTYSVTVTSPNGCTGTSQTQLVVNPLPVANTGSSISYCNGQSGIIGSAPIGGYSYSWLTTTGLSSSTISNPLVTIANTGSTPSLNEYTLTVTLNGCQSSNTVIVTVNPIPVSNAGSPITLCAGQSGTIGVASTNGYSYAWTPATNLSSSAVSNPTVTGINGGFTASNTIYTVISSDALTLCQSSSSVTVSVLPLPVVSVSTVQSVCEGVLNIPINGTLGGSALSGIWSGGLGSINPNNTSLNGNYSPTAIEFTNGSVTLTLTAIAQAPCQNVSSVVNIGFYKKPVVNYTVNIPKGCPEHCVVFADQSSVSAPDFIQQWSWDFGDGGVSSSQNPSHCYSNTGLYTVSLTAISNHLCSSQLTIPQMIEVYAMPIASFVPNPLVAGILDPNIDFQNTSQGAVSYFWNFGDYAALGASNTSTVTNPSHAYTYADIYNVNLVATSVHGCIDIVSVSVEIKPEFTFYIPNCFTPGSSEGVNDIFYGMGIGIEKYEMWIFDRWGANIFYSDDIYKGWNGKVLGKPNEVQQDVYIWKVKLKDVFNKNHEYIGHVTLLK